MSIGRRPKPVPESADSKDVEEEPLKEAQISIGERVKFWEEQDKINQALIPRVIRQNERLDEHIENHEDPSEIRDLLRGLTRLALIAAAIGTVALILSVVALVLSVL
jgi:hypothetical protein